MSLRTPKIKKRKRMKTKIHPIRNQRQRKRRFIILRQQKLSLQTTLLNQPRKRVNQLRQRLNQALRLLLSLRLNSIQDMVHLIVSTESVLLMARLMSSATSWNPFLLKPRPITFTTSPLPMLLRCRLDTSTTSTTYLYLYQFKWRGQYPCLCQQRPIMYIMHIPGNGQVDHMVMVMTTRSPWTSTGSIDQSTIED